MKTQAQVFADAFGNDGTRFETDEGYSFDQLMADIGVPAEYSRRVYDGSSDGEYESGYESEHAWDNSIRWEFSDGSCIVSVGHGWDFEGDVRFSWKG